MTYERTILVGVDGSLASRDALIWACQLGRLANLNVRAVMAWHFPPGSEPTDSVEETSSMVRSQLAEVTAGSPCEHLELLTVQGLALTGLMAAASRARCRPVGDRQNEDSEPSLICCSDR